VLIRRWKTDQEGQGETIAIARGSATCPVKALKAPSHRNDMSPMTSLTSRSSASSPSLTCLSAVLPAPQVGKSKPSRWISAAPTICPRASVIAAARARPTWDDPKPHQRRRQVRWAPRRQVGKTHIGLGPTLPSPSRNRCVARRKGAPFGSASQPTRSKKTPVERTGAGHSPPR
jgi:hypothetical protein